MPQKTLTNRMRRFIDLYTGECAGNGAEAARRAGYCKDDPGNARNVASKLLQKAVVREAISRHLEESAITATEVIHRLSLIARARFDDLAECFEEDEAGRRVLNLEKLRASGVGHIVESVTPTKHGDSVRLHSSQKALETLGRFHALWRDRVQVNHELTPEILASLSDAELEAITQHRTPPGLEAKLGQHRGAQAALPGPADEVIIDVESDIEGN